MRTKKYNGKLKREVNTTQSGKHAGNTRIVIHKRIQMHEKLVHYLKVHANLTRKLIPK